MKKLVMPAGVAVIAALAALQGCKDPKTPAVAPTSPEPAVLPADNVLPATVATDDGYREPSVPAAPVVKPLPPPPPPPAVKPAPVPVPPVAPSTYTIKKGDTLSGIAKAHHMKQKDILAANPGMNANKIYAGRTIKMPAAAAAPATPAPKPAPAPKTPVAPAVKPLPSPAPAPAPAPAVADAAGTYTVQKGDTLSGIAKKLNLKQKDILAANPGMKADKIAEGKKIALPGGTAPAEPQPKNDASESGKNKVTPDAEQAVKKPDADIKAPTVDPGDVKQPDPAPAPALPVYVAKESDDIYTVAIQFGLSPEDVAKLNNLNLAEPALKPGQKVLLPEGTAVNE